MTIIEFAHEHASGIGFLIFVLILAWGNRRP